IQDAIELKVLDDEAIEELRLPEAAPPMSAPELSIYDVMDKKQADETRANFIAALLDAAHRAAKLIAARGSKEVAFAVGAIREGFYTNIGTGAGILSVLIIVRNGPAILEYVARFNSPEVTELVKWILQLFG